MLRFCSKERRKPRAGSQAQFPTPGFLQNPTFAMHGAPVKPASADAAASPMRAYFPLPLTLGVSKFNRYRLNIMKGTTLDSGIVYLRGKSFQAFSISGTALQRSFKAV
jgi:hypothetical protein